jgi:hypothetical protein
MKLQVSWLPISRVVRFAGRVLYSGSLQSSIGEQRRMQPTSALGLIEVQLLSSEVIRCIQLITMIYPEYLRLRQEYEAGLLPKLG